MSGSLVSASTIVPEIFPVLAYAILNRQMNIDSEKDNRFPLHNVSLHKIILPLKYFQKLVPQYSGDR